jgi:uracil-DNA glycosylase
MRLSVRSYGAGAIEVSNQIDGTAFFPGGGGLWRGLEPYGKLPDEFPNSPIMFLGHNFDSVKGYRQSCSRGIERMNTGTWYFLIRYLMAAELNPANAFYTNAFVGLQPEKANGTMFANEAFYQECRTFLVEQISIVRPRLIVALGQNAARELDLVTGRLSPLQLIPSIQLIHPGAIVYCKSVERDFLIEQQGTLLKAAWQSLPDVI